MGQARPQETVGTHEAGQLKEICFEIQRKRADRTMHTVIWRALFLIKTNGC
jgi:hypothetical protein